MTVFSNPCSDTSLQDNTAAFPAMIEWATATNRAIAPMEFPDALHYLMKDQKMTVEHLEETSLISTRTIIRLSTLLRSSENFLRYFFAVLHGQVVILSTLRLNFLRKLPLNSYNTALCDFAKDFIKS